MDRESIQNKINVFKNYDEIVEDILMEWIGLDYEVFSTKELIRSFIWSDDLEIMFIEDDVSFRYRIGQCLCYLTKEG